MMWLLATPQLGEAKQPVGLQEKAFLAFLKLPEISKKREKASLVTL
jgi:hypothetical protein